MLLFGMPGSGKGTQGRALGCLPGFLHVSSGDVFRQLHKAGQLGKEVDKYTSLGRLVPDDLTVKIFFNHMDVLSRKGQFDPQCQMILADGIPRTFGQARILDDKLDILRIFYLKLQSDDEAVERIKHRALAEGRADDADESVIRDRLNTFYRQTADALRFYDESIVCEINATESPVQVLADLTREITAAIAEPQALRPNAL
jgi:adenylate kinase